MSKVIDDLILTSMMVPMNDPNSETCQWGLPLFLWGDPGIGKSTRVRAAGARLSLPVYVLNMPTFTPDDFGPLTVYRDGHMEHISPIPAVNKIFESGDGILVLDELSSAKPAVQAAALGTLLDRTIAGKLLPPGVRVIAAGNPPSSAASGWELEPPTANRLCHVGVEAPMVSEWVGYMRGGSGVKKEKFREAETKVKTTWSASWEKALAATTNHVITSNTHLHMLPNENSDERSQAWPSPRTWEFTTRAYATCIAIGASSEVLKRLVRGCVGKGVGDIFLKTLINPRTIGALLTTTEWVTSTADVASISEGLSSIVNHVIADQSSKEATNNIVHVWRVIGLCIDKGLSDMVGSYMKQLINKNLAANAADATISKAATEVLKKYA